MGLGSMAKGAAKKAVGLGSSFFSNSYRTGVINDFSVVEKATFTIVNVPTKDEPGAVSYETIPVQINPGDLVFQYSSPVHVQTGGMNGKSDELESYSFHDGGNSLSMTLYYDFYDEYNTRSMNGFLGSMSNFHLESEEYSSLKKLVDFTREQSAPRVLFHWGSFDFFGVMETLSPSYRAFSQWGQPLKAEVSVSIREEKNTGLAGEATSNRDRYGTISHIGTALLGAGLALR